EAPVKITWARRSSGDLLRVPEYRRGREIAARIEYRAPDPGCNPYLAFAAILAAGLEGIEREYPLPPSRDPGEADELADTMPGSLYEAIRDAENSDRLHRCLGDHAFESLLLNKQTEWAPYGA